MVVFPLPYNNKDTCTSMKFFNAAMNMAIKAKAKARKDYNYFTQRGIECDYQKMFECQLKDQLETFDTALKLCEEMSQRAPAQVNSFVLTIAPKHDVDVIDFITLVHKFAKSSMFIAYAYAFEQKGTTLDTIGTHPHCHIVVATTYCKSHILRRVRDKFECMCDEGGMQVDKSKTPSQFITNYLIAHIGREDKPDAKSLTSGTDSLWRTQMNLIPLYTSDNATEIWNFSVDVTKSNNIDTEI